MGRIRVNSIGGKFMRKKYEKPCMNMENFEANEYIAACWSATCNVPHLIKYTKQDSLTKNSGYGVKDGSIIHIQGYGCNESHVIKTEGNNEPVSNGSWTTINKLDGLKPDHEYNGRVYIWEDGTGLFDKDYHFIKAGSWSQHERANHS